MSRRRSSSKPEGNLFYTAVHDHSKESRTEARPPPLRSAPEIRGTLGSSPSTHWIVLPLA